MKAFFTAFFMALLLVSPVSAEKAAKEPVFNYLAEVDEITADVNVVHTIYKGMPIEDLKSNFENLEGWTFEDKGVMDVVASPDYNGHHFLITRKYNKSTPVYELIHVYADYDNQTVGHYIVMFHATTESAGKIIYGRIVNNYTRALGEPSFVDNGSWAIGKDSMIASWNKNGQHFSTRYSKLSKEGVVKAHEFYNFPKPVVCRISMP